MLTAAEVAAARTQYPGLSGRIFVNHAAVSQISLGVQRAMVEATELHVRDALGSRPTVEAVYAEGRARAAA